MPNHQVLAEKTNPLPAPKPIRTYTREYLLWCSQYEACWKMPKVLAELVHELPQVCSSWVVGDEMQSSDTYLFAN